MSAADVEWRLVLGEKADAAVVVRGAVFCAWVPESEAVAFEGGGEREGVLATFLAVTTIVGLGNRVGIGFILVGVVGGLPGVAVVDVTAQGGRLCQSQTDLRG